MASNAAKQPWLSGSVLDPISRKINECLATKTRFFRVRKAPVTEFVPSDIGGDESIPRYESASGGLHQSLKKLAIFLAVYVGIGTLCFCFVLDDLKGKKTNPILDSVYFVITTMTTVGYGDLVPDSASAKLLASIFVFLGMTLIGLILSKAGDYLVTKQEMFLVKALRMREKLGPNAVLKLETESNKLKYKCYFAVAILLILMLVGSIFLYVDEDFDTIDAFYCVCSTMTTLGFGDKAFSSGGGRMFAICWMLTSTVGLGQLFLYIIELLTESRQMALANWVLTRTTNLDLEAPHIDDDRIVRPAEFILYKLKEMGKISEEDIEPVMKEFEELDASDKMLAQTTPMKK